ncbi:MAG TPA: SBBP repeat-containing protein [Ignavibacteria bacterium]|nr:SBBP repeat-containing protein [Ignavibacteria bacterium]HMR00582.1 SBBP repeat-containing protein [Ignavibacteria bacterium]
MKNSTKTILTAVFLLIAAISQIRSQPAPPVDWIRNNISGDANDMVTDNSGNIYVTGVTYAGSTNDFCTIKYNSSGVQQWSVTYNGTDDLGDQASSIAVDNQGNVYVTGTANINYSNTVWTGDYCTIKYNSSGQQQWVRIYSGNTTGRDIPFKVAVDGTGNVVVTGQSYIDAQRNDDIVTIKYAPDGTQMWLVYHDGTGTTPEQDSGRDMVLDAQGNIYIFGHSTRLVTWYDLFLIKYNPSGAVQFTRDYAGPINNTTEYGVALTLDNSGNIYCIGELSDGSLAVLKYNSSGVQQWAYIYTSGFFNKAKDITTDAAGNVLFCGSAGSTGFTAKLNSSGTLMWNRIITGTGGNEIANSLIIDNMGDIYVTGKVAAGSYFDFVTEKINPAGTVQWRATHGGSGNLNDFGNAVSRDASGNIIVSGGSNVGGFNNFCTIKYAPGTIGIEPSGNNIPESFTLHQNFPNPFNPVTNINFDLPLSSYVKLSVFDITGREIETLVNENLKSGTYKADWNASNLPSGVYFYKLEAEGFTETKKMMLVK